MPPAPSPPFRFPPLARLRAAADFQRVFADGRRLSGTLFRLHALLQAGDTDHGPRLGIAVSRRVDPSAVVRNRIKRQSRESFRAIRADLPQGDYVLVARREAAQAASAALRADLAALWRRAIALKPEAGTGTMPGSAAARSTAADSAPPSS